jgi:uncharacterized protein (TIGR00369 family)
MDVAGQIAERMKGLFPDVLGMHFIEATPELVRAKLTVREEICTTGNILHGGAVMAFADTLGAVATVLNLPAAADTTTLESKTNFLRAAPVGTTITGETTPIHRGRTTMVWQTRILSEDDKLIAIVTQTQMVLTPK